MKKTLLLILLLPMLVGCRKTDYEIKMENIGEIKDELVLKGVDPDLYSIKAITNNSYKITPNDKGAEYLVDIEHKQVGTLNMPKVEKIININEVK